MDGKGNELDRVREVGADRIEMGNEQQSDAEQTEKIQITDTSEGIIIPSRNKP